MQVEKEGQGGLWVEQGQTREEAEGRRGPEEEKEDADEEARKSGRRAEESDAAPGEVSAEEPEEWDRR